MNLPSIKFSLGLRGGGGFFSSPRRQRARVKEGGCFIERRARSGSKERGQKGFQLRLGEGAGGGTKRGGDQEGSSSLLISEGEERGRCLRRIRQGVARRSRGGSRKGYQRGGERARGRGVERGCGATQIPLKKIFQKNRINP